MVFCIPVLVLAVVLLAVARRNVVGTTLAAVWAWAAVAVIAVGGVEIGVWFATGAGAGAVVGPGVPLPAWCHAARYAAAVLALCPTVALLGAKRPQDRAWQWVVAAFWAVMMVPAARAYLLQGGDAVVLHTSQGVFLLAVAAMGVANWIATRFAVAALMGGAAQTLLVAPYTPLAGMLPELPLALPVAALVGIAAALLARYWLARRQRGGDPIERVWLEFRDQYGLFWSARLMARLNAAARLHGCPAAIHWRSVTIDAGDEHARTALARSLRMLLRRFVSTKWLSANGGAA